MATDHRKLSAFALADELALRIYHVTAAFPASERYGLQSQLRRAAVSVACNIVEGCARDSDREHDRFFEIAFASSREVRYLIELAHRLGFVPKEVADQEGRAAGRVAATLAGLRKSIPSRGKS